MHSAVALVQLQGGCLVSPVPVKQVSQAPTPSHRIQMLRSVVRSRWQQVSRSVLATGSLVSSASSSLVSTSRYRVARPRPRLPSRSRRRPHASPPENATRLAVRQRLVFLAASLLCEPRACGAWWGARARSGDMRQVRAHAGHGGVVDAEESACEVAHAPLGRVPGDGLDQWRTQPKGFLR